MATGKSVGFADGTIEGPSVGDKVAVEGLPVGPTEGVATGKSVGFADGTVEGPSVGEYEELGCIDGPTEGRKSGEAEGITETQENKERNSKKGSSMLQTGR